MFTHAVLEECPAFESSKIAEETSKYEDSGLGGHKEMRKTSGFEPGAIVLLVQEKRQVNL